MAKITIIVTVFNLENYIADCILSLKKQSLHDFDALIINDGSTDKSVEVIKNSIIDDKRFRLINQANLGVSAARNRALDESTSDYLMFVDGDDYLSEHCLKVAFSSISTNDIVVFDYKKIKNNVVINNSRFDKKILNEKDSYLLAIESITLEPNPWGKLYRKIVFNNIRYPEGIQYEDYAVCYKIFENRKVIFIEDQLYYYRVRDGSIMRSFNRERIRDKQKIINDMLSYIDYAHADAKLKRSFNNSYLFHFVFVTSNVIFNSSANPIKDAYYLSETTNHVFFNLKNIFQSTSLKHSEKFYLFTFKISPIITFFLKKFKTWIKK